MGKGEVAKNYILSFAHTGLHPSTPTQTYTAGKAFADFLYKKICIIIMVLFQALNNFPLTCTAGGKAPHKSATYMLVIRKHFKYRMHTKNWWSSWIWKVKASAVNLHRGFKTGDLKLVTSEWLFSAFIYSLCCEWAGACTLFCHPHFSHAFLKCSSFRMLWPFIHMKKAF